MACELWRRGEPLFDYNCEGLGEAQWEAERDLDRYY
jgi:hypothetical protein